MDFLPIVFDYNDAMIDEVGNRLNHPRTFYQAEDAFELRDEAFRNIFRINKNMADELITLVTDRIPPPARPALALDPTTKVLTALRFLASGSYQMDIGLNIFMGISQPSVSKCLHQVVDILNEPEIFNEWVYFPRNLQELQAVRDGFYDSFRFPGVIGCIDCTHVAIVPPRHDIEYLYINRKGYHSINTQLICDANYRIINVNARYSGRTHDSFIWNNCQVLPLMQRLHAAGHDRFFLLGDSGYGLRPWLMTPITNAAPGSPEERYTRRVTLTRSLIERVNAVLKMRFRCLSKERVLHYTPDFAAKIINACVVLHNMCIANRILPPVMRREYEGNIEWGMHAQFPDDGVDNAIERVNPGLARGRAFQHRLIQAYFA